MARFCSECGTSLPANAAFCPSCGHAVSPVTPQKQENWEVMVGDSVPHQEVPPPPPVSKPVTAETPSAPRIQANPPQEAHHASLLGPALIQAAMGLVTALITPGAWSSGPAIALSVISLISGLLAGRKRGLFSSVLKIATWLLMLLNGASLISILISASGLPTDVPGLIAFAVPQLATFVSCYRTLKAFSKISS